MFAAVNQVGEIKILVFLANEKSEKSHSKISKVKKKTWNYTTEIYEFQLKERISQSVSFENIKMKTDCQEKKKKKSKNMHLILFTNFYPQIGIFKLRGRERVKNQSLYSSNPWSLTCFVIFWGDKIQIISSLKETCVENYIHKQNRHGFQNKARYI